MDIDAGGPFEALGAQVSASLRVEVEALDLVAAARATQFPVVVLDSSPQVDRSALRASLNPDPHRTRWLTLESQVAWRMDAALNAAAIPLDILGPFIAAIKVQLTDD